MFSIKKFCCLLLVVTIAFACKQPGDNNLQPKGKLVTPEGWSKGGIDGATMQMLMQNGDHVDYIFNELPLSMNQDGQNAVFQELQHVSNQALDGIPSDCQPLARKIFIGDGEILMEADIYFSQNCLFQIFIKDEKPLFGNILSQQGILFYKKLLTQAQQTMPADMRNRYQIPEGI